VSSALYKKGFEVKTSLRHGDRYSTMYPVLLNLALEQVVRDIKENRYMELVENRILLGYMDNIVILRESQVHSS